MIKSYRVLDIRNSDDAPSEHVVEAGNPENAVAIVLGVDAVRGSSKRIKPVARVYWSDPNGNTNMVRLYPRLASFR